LPATTPTPLRPTPAPAPTVRRCADCNHPCTNPNAPAGYCSWMCWNADHNDR
jgi:hypothetical protein